MARVFDPGRRQAARPFGKARPPPRLLNPSRPRRRRRIRRVLLGVAVVGAVMAVLMAVSSGDVWAAAHPGFAAAAAAGLGIFAAYGGGAPSVTCAGCGAIGWQADVAATGGICPYCGGSLSGRQGQADDDEGDGDDGHHRSTWTFSDSSWDDGDSGSDSGSDSGGDSGGGDGGGGD